MIQIQDLMFKQQNEVLFNHLDFTFKSQTFSLLVGDSGSGKSTLLRLLGGFAPLDYQGNILINGKELKHTSMQVKAQHVGIVFQNPSQQFTMRTLKKEIIFALENIGLSPAEITSRLKAALELGNTKNLAEQDLNQLSGGEKQRAALSVLLALDAPVLLLDEPFASIDIESRKVLIELLAGLKKQGKTIILIDHDLSNYRDHIDQVVELKDGTLKKVSLSILTEQKRISLVRPDASRTSFFELKDVSYGYGKRRLLTANDFVFQQGITTLTGANGSGKSTLLRSMAQRHKYHGKMFMYDKRVKRNRKLYQHLSIAVQDAAKQFVTLIPASELAFSRNQIEHASEKQNEALEALGLGEKRDSSLFHLSEGQKKMVQLISMLSLELDFLMLDEPFSGLDQRACEYFMNWIKLKSPAQNFLIISHRLSPLAGVSHHHAVIENQTLWRGER